MNKWLQKPWLLISTVQGKPTIAGEHCLEWGAKRHKRSLEKMPPLTRDRIPTYKVVRRSEWDAR